MIDVDLPAYYRCIRKRPRDHAQAAMRVMQWGRWVWQQVRLLPADEEMQLLDRDAEKMGGSGWWR